ncbi:hypothetical protein EIB18_02410 [Caulobacter vibrioides]|uniref:Uncharacterized protein n=1 Tax=Caulobacter vibrioides (strain NA1000 / CB15N) TaxID=565050 RepID=A0A0H3C5H8_CAUVN|nr:hypothetical protein [Caulobacter vibrioides]YP_002515849.1 hypothetical protein CCNA_00476 [Caulobacter vibrioides NA1000]ACL93941.1 hypothetical protein CCNA_00476 [Caulobacter vibrioides NA1000]ATC27293.1 hypothetical protein CA607_02400 [Caulobacter vibrioides]AZH11675.1 hypothetical protein EIB18_02410 [Caulobacter vibrioides]
MNKVTLSLRIPSAMNAVLTDYAKAPGYCSRYQAAIRAFETGLGVLVGSTQFSPGDEAVTDSLGELLARASRLEALVDRTLFTASAAYAYARRSIVRTEADHRMDQLIAEAAQDAYRRQRDLARGAHQ